MITDLLERQARDRPRAPFLHTEIRSYSFAEVYDASRRFATVLATNGVGGGTHVALIADNGAPFIVAMMAASWLGAVVVALNNELLADGLRYSLAQSDTKVIVADERWIAEKSRHLDDSLRALPFVPLSSESGFFASLEGVAPARGFRANGADTAVILYTSGTTGLPKGVMNSHDCYEAVGRDTVEALGLAPEDRIMVFLPLFHTNPQMYAVMSALSTGCSLILRPKFSATTFFEDAKRFDATGVTFVGTVMSILVVRHEGERKDHRMRFAIGGGAPPAVWQAVHDRFGFRIHELYGMTEIGGWVTCNTASAYRLGSCGKRRASMDVRVFDEHDREVPVGAQGEIVVRPLEPNVILTGYYKKPEAMLASLRNLWFHTGDRGSFDADGFLYFHGRNKELIRRGGEMISPVEIETQLRGLAGVEDCAVVGVPDAILGEEIKVALVAANGMAPREVAEYLRDRVPRHMQPRYVEFLDRIPKTETEKIQRNKLQYLGDNVHDLARQA